MNPQYSTPLISALFQHRTAFSGSLVLLSVLLGCAKPPAPVRVAAPAPAVVLSPQPVPVAPTVPIVVNDHVHTGRIACELGQFINVEADPVKPGQYVVTGKGFKFHMQRVPTTTGVVRLEDAKAGAVWLQIANKSMLMNQKQGRRMADECASPTQQMVAAQLRSNAQMGNLFDTPNR